jgi:tetratricopeptide (TPR) repeat protein
MILYGIRGQQYQLDRKPFSSGGEGDVFRIAGVNDKVVKIYHQGHTSGELEEKIKLMVRKPPSSNILNQVAWPLDVVYDTSKQFRGFVMPKLDITNELNEVYVYPPKTGITYQQKLVLAQNICVVIHEVHRAGYVFGDFNPRNIGINLNTGAVAFLDTDSYHIVISKDKNQAYRCNVCAPGYAAPELLSKCSYHILAHPEDKQQAYAKTSLDTFTKETDNFALAIHIFKLLMNGFTPFNGIAENDSVSAASPGVGDVAVRRDNYCFKPGNKPQAVAVPPLNTLPHDIQVLFTRAFIDGRDKPEKRPPAIEWHKALFSFENNLVMCKRNSAHMFKKELKTCPWCEADDRYNASIAPQLKQRTFSNPVTPPIAPAPIPIPVALPANTNVSFQNISTAQLNTFGTSAQSFKQQSASGVVPTRKCMSPEAKKMLLLVSSITAVLIVGFLIYRNMIVPANKYNKASNLFTEGDYFAAIDAYSEIVGYSDSNEKMKEAKYQIAIEAMDSGEYQTAYKYFDQIGDYQDSRELYLKARYLYADALFQNENYKEAINEFKECGNYDDSVKRIEESCYLYGRQLENNEEFVSAIEMYESSNGYKDSVEKIENIKSNHPMLFANVGELVKFGTYEQDNDYEDGKEEIEWIVIDKEGNSVLLISNYCLDCKPNVDGGGSYTWKYSLLYPWLTQTFFNEAFSEEEQEKIISPKDAGVTEIIFSDVPDDKITLLNTEEADMFFDSDASRKAYPTEYAISQGVYVDGDNGYVDAGGGSCLWYLRPPSGSSTSMVYVAHVNGWLSYYVAKGNNDMGVRPVIWVDSSK